MCVHPHTYTHKSVKCKLPVFKEEENKQVILKVYFAVH